MKKMILICFVVLNASALCAASKKVQVYENSQQYYDVQSGETLDQICRQLFASNHHQQAECQQRLVMDNPDAFIGQSPDRLLAGKRLWLPGSYRAQSQLDNKNYHLQRFSWGEIKTPK